MGVFGLFQRQKLLTLLCIMFEVGKRVLNFEASVLFGAIERIMDLNPSEWA